MPLLRFLALLLFMFSTSVSNCEEALSTFHGDPSGIVFDAVDVISGSYREFEIDIIVQAPTPLCLQRSYSSGRRIWCFFPHCSLVVGKQGKSRVAITSESCGTPLSYSKTSDSEYVLDLECHHGIVNTAKGKISAQTNLKNNSIKIDDSNCVLTTSNGTLRYYSKSSKKDLGALCENSFPKLKEKTFYRLTQEILPSGNKIFYQYTDEGYLREIQATNGEKTKIFCSLKFRYDKDEVKVQASDNQTVTYHFHDGLLTKVASSSKPKIRYHYTQGNLTKKELPDGRFLTFEYTHERRVKALYTQASSKPFFTFHYEQNSTSVTNVLQQKILYSHNNGKLDTREVFEGNILYRKEKWIWGQGNEAGRLLARVLSDSQGRPLFAHRYYYDPEGNIVRDELHGNVLGGPSEVVTLDSQNLPLSNTNLSCSQYSFSQDRFHNLLQQKDCKGNSITYEYKPNTNLLEKKFICEGTRIRERSFYSYNDDAILIRKQIDDSDNSDAKQLLYAKEVHIWELQPRNYEKNSIETITEKYYDSNTQQEKIKKVISHTIDEQGNIITRKILDASGQLLKKEKYSFDSRGNCIRAVNSLGEETTFSYDENDNCIIKEEHANRRRTDYHYNRQNQLISLKEHYPDKSTIATAYEYDLTGNKTSIIDRYGNRIVLAYDFLSRLSSITYPAVFDEKREVIHPKETFKYDLLDNIITKTDPKGYEESISYNVKGQPLSIHYPDDTVERFKWDQEGTLHRKLHRDHTVTVYEYDYLGRPVHTETHAIDGTGTPASYLFQTTASYFAFHIYSTQDEERNAVYYRYDSLGRLISTWDITSLYVEYDYDALDRPHRIRKWIDNKSAIVACTQYDALDRPLEKWYEQPDASRLWHELITYDAFGNAKSEDKEKIKYKEGTRPYLIVNAEGDETHIEYKEKPIDGVFALQKEIFYPKGESSCVTYDALGREVLYICKDASGKITSKKEQLFDAAGNLAVTLEAVISKDVSREIRTQWVYGPMNRLEVLREAVGTPEMRETVYSYNSFGALASVLYPGDPVPYQYNYTKKGDVCSIQHGTKVVASYSYDNLHRITKGTSCDGITTERKYDSQNNIISEEITTPFGSYKTAYEYDKLGRVLKYTLPDSSTLEYSYNGAVAAKVNRIVEGKELYCHIFTEHNDQGFHTKESLIGKGGTRKTRYAHKEPSSIKTQFFKEHITKRDPFGNPLKIERQGKEFHLSYDDLGQLIKANEHYNYDSLGNLIATGTISFDYNSLNELTSSECAKYSYDRQGNLKEISTSQGLTTFSYNAENQLTSFQNPSGEKVTYLWDIFGRRIVRQEEKNPTENKIFFYLGMSEVGALDTNNKVIEWKAPSQVVDDLAIGAIALELKGKVYLPIFDLSESIVAVVDPETEEIVESYKYSAFGQEEIYDRKGRNQTHSLVGNSWRYRGVRTDQLTGLVQMGRRDYDPKLQRFITPDPLGFFDGSNHYAYVHNNPIRYIDRRGLATEPNGVDPNYFYGNVEPHCYCERHRTCKRGGDLASHETSFPWNESEFDVSELGLERMLDDAFNAWDNYSNATILAGASTAPFCGAGFPVLSCGIGMKLSGRIAKVALPVVKSAAPSIKHFATRSFSYTRNAIKNSLPNWFKATGVIKEEIRYTRSNLRLGQQMHRAYRRGQANGETTFKEYVLPSRRRIDFLDAEKGIIYEYKPNNPRSIRDGLRQTEEYREELKTLHEVFGRSDWKIELELY